MHKFDQDFGKGYYMAHAVWNVFDNISNVLADAPGPEHFTKADAILDAAMETIADVLPTATHAVLEEGALQARELLFGRLMTQGADDASASYVAGRLSAIVDVLAYAARQTVDEAQIRIVQQQPYASVLAKLHEGPMRNVDLVAALKKDKAQVSRWLDVLRLAGTVVSQKQGRDVFNALTPLGRSIVEDGIQEQMRVPIETSRIHSFDAERPFNLNQYPTPERLDDGDLLPVISAAAR